MISCRSDFFQHMQKQREKIKLIIVFFDDFRGEDAASIWAYANDRGVNIYDYSPILIMDLDTNALNSLRRSFTVLFSNTDFSKDIPEFVEGPTLSDAKQRMYRETMKYTFEEMKAGAPLYTGSYDIHSNNKGVVFGIIELFKPKFNMGDKVRYKNQEKQMREGFISGLDLSSGEYSIVFLASEDVIWVKESDIYPAESK